MTAPYWSNGVATLYQADARAIPLPDGSVHCCIASPPYWGLRSYNLGAWIGGDSKCSHQKRRNDAVARVDGGVPANNNHAQEGWAGGVCGHCGATQEDTGIGLEPTLTEWVDNIVAVGREVWRVLRDDGSFWLNLGDAYSGGGKGTTGRNDGDRKRAEGGAFNGGARIQTDTDCGLPSKNLMGQPWRAAFALQDDGWILRSAICWQKNNPMPESVYDRPTSSYEMIFLLTKQPIYFYDQTAIREPQSEGTHARFGSGKAPRAAGKKLGGSTRHKRDWDESTPDSILPNGRNSRNVWTIPTQGRPEAHFATFPDELPRRCILAGTSEHGVCADCGAPWARQTEKSTEYDHTTSKAGKTKDGPYAAQTRDGAGTHDIRHGVRVNTQTVGWQPACDHNAARVPATVLDCFVGSGTTVAVAQQLGRHGIGLDLNLEYLGIAKQRIEKVSLPLF